MGIFGYLKGMIALAILAFIGYMNIWAFNFTGEATAEDTVTWLRYICLLRKLIFYYLLSSLLVYFCLTGPSKRK